MENVAATQLSGEDVLQMGDVGPCELIDGVLIPLNPPGVPHGYLVARITRYLDAFVAEHNLGWVLSGDTGVYIRRNPDTVRGIDIAFVSRQRMPDGPQAGYLTVAPDLIIEIVSPSDRWLDIEDKLRDYFSIGVGQVWLVHL